MTHAETLSGRFDDTASRYDLMVSLNPGYHEHLRSAADELTRRTGEDASFADLGCGSGASTGALLASLGDAAPRADVLGVDASPGMLAAAEAKTWPAGVRFRVGLAEDFTAGPSGGPFGGVLACYLFRNVVDRDRGVATVFDALAPGGWLVVQEYSVAESRRSIALWTFICWAVVIPLSLVLTGRTVLYRYLWRSVLDFDTVARFEQRLTEAGFTDVSTSTVDGWQQGILHTFVARRPV